MSMSFSSSVFSGFVWYLMWERDRGRLCGLFVFALHKESEQFSFSFYIDGSSSDETETVLLQDVIAVLHHLGSTSTRRTQMSVSLTKRMASYELRTVIYKLEILRRKDKIVRHKLAIAEKVRIVR